MNPGVGDFGIPNALLFANRGWPRRQFSVLQTSSPYWDPEILELRFCSKSFILRKSLQLNFYYEIVFKVFLMNCHFLDNSSSVDFESGANKYLW